MHPSGSSVFDWNNPKRVKLLNRLRPGLSHLCQHKFKHSFQDSLNSICSCGNNIEMSSHFPIHFRNYRNQRSRFLNIIWNIDGNILPECSLQEPKRPFMEIQQNPYLQWQNRFLNQTHEADIWLINEINLFLGVNV